MTTDLVTAVADLQEDRIMQIINEKLKGSDPPIQLVEQLREGMKIVGARYEEGEYFLTELVFAGDLLQKAVEVIKPHLKSNEAGKDCTIVIGTVKGDIHNIGKDLVATMLECEGYQVHNIGVDLNPQEIVNAVKQHQANVLGMSCLLTAGIPYMKETVELLEKEGLRSGIKIIVGGSSLYGNVEGVMAEIKADVIGVDAVDAIRKIKDLCDA